MATVLSFFEDREELSPAAWVVLLGAITVPLVLGIARYLRTDPLGQVPGPWLASISSLYGFFYNLKRGGYSKQFLALHQRYKSSIIRIGPRHVHVDSLAAYEELFSPGTKYYKDPGFYNSWGGLGGMTDPHEHRSFKSRISSLFSARFTATVVPRLLEELEKVSSRLRNGIGQNEAVNIQKLVRTLTSNMVSHTLFTTEIDFFDSQHEYHPFLDSLDSLARLTWPLLQFPWMTYLLGLLPQSQEASAYVNFRKDCQSKLNDTHQKGPLEGKGNRRFLIDCYRQIENDDSGKVVHMPDLVDDMFNFLMAGSDTTAYTISSAIYYILSSPGVLHRLREELDEAAPLASDDTLDHLKIQGLPYLGAVVKETLRLASPVAGCLPRLVPPGGATIESVYLPAGTTISVSNIVIQRNEELFPKPLEFNPDRWLGEKGKALEKWNVAFSKGPRQCIGMNLAYLEMHCCIAYLFSRFELSLAGNYGPTLEWADRFISRNLVDVQVKVLGDRWSSNAQC